MTTAQTIALLQAMTLPTPADTTAVVEWVHLLPAGEITTQDGRGPYRVADAGALIVASLPPGVKLPIDENHAIDLAAPRGEASPARGHIVELQARADGIWGRVDWTASGRRLIRDRAYLGLSPAIIHDAANRVLGILRASLVNRPNLRGLTALHQEDTMSLSQRLAALLGLDAGASDDALFTGVTALHQQSAASALTPALQAQMAQIGVALGVPESATPEAILAAARGKIGAAPGAEAVVALQAELNSVVTQLNTLRDGAARERAEQFVDGQIRLRRSGVKPLRDHYVAMHMVDPARVEKEITTFPVQAASSMTSAPPPAANGQVALHHEQREALRLGGFDPKAYAAVLAEERNQGEAL